MPIDRTLWNRRIKTRDGVEIATDVLLPEGAGPFPVVVLRTPYGRSRSADRWLGLIEKGYGLAFVDMRGRGDSGGDWKPFVKDVEDGYDVIEWIGTQPWCTGRVGMVSGSYEGISQWWAAAGRPPHLKCIVPMAVGVTRDSDVPCSGTGVPVQYWLWWLTMVTARTNQNAGAPSWEHLMPTLPLRDLDERLGTGHSSWKDYVAGKVDFNSTDFTLGDDEIAALDIPVMVGVGWWDDQATMPNWLALQKAKSARDCRLLIGAWDHAGNLAPRPVLGGIDVYASVIDAVGYVEKFLALHLKGEANEMAGAQRCHIFETGRKRWDDLDQWPHPDASEVAFHLASGGDARSLRGNGTLAPERAKSGADRDTYIYDPNNPGRDMTNMAMFAWSDPPLDNRFALRRKDVLVYDSAALEKPLFVSGQVHFDLFVSSDRVDTDIVIHLCDVHPDGRSIALGGDGLLRLSYRDGPQQKMLAPGEVARIRIAAHWLHHVFQPGHRVRIAISSNGFPFSIRNAGTGEFWADDTVLLPQTNSIHHSAAHPSRVLLPVVAEKI